MNKRTIGNFSFVETAIKGVFIIESKNTVTIVDILWRLIKNLTLVKQALIMYLSKTINLNQKRVY